MRSAILLLPVLILVAAGCIRPVSVQLQASPPPVQSGPTVSSPNTETPRTRSPGGGNPTPVEETSTEPALIQTAAFNGPVEIKPLEIPISGPLSEPMAEISGLAWHAGRLIFLPQYPDRFPGDSNGSLFFLDKTEILAFIDGKAAGPLEPHPIPFQLFAVQDQIKGYEGFESIAFVDDTAYLTIEASPFGMMGYLTSAYMVADGSRLTLDLAHLGQIPPQTALPNMTNEAILILGRRILTFYEANGQRINKDPVAQLFDTQMQQQDTITLPNIEYRLTDATPPDEFGRFWVINIYNPREILLLPGPDALSEEFGKGRTHSQSTTVERLVELQIGESGIVFSDTPPIQLELGDDDKPRNWEGIARLDDRGFLIVTDRIPGTILAFVPFP